MMISAEWKLPLELVAFLNSGEQLKYDISRCAAGDVKLKRPEALEEFEVIITSFDTPYEIADPMAGRGYWVVRAVGLVATRNGKDEGSEMLLWYPDYQQFGQWDREHQNAIRFFKAKWRTIVKNPSQFLNAIYDEVDKSFARPVLPWKDGIGESRKGDPPF
jgi:hypothetical protein